jgi:hypothetical protein
MAHHRHVEVQGFGKNLAIDQQVLQHVLDRSHDVGEKVLRCFAHEQRLAGG